MSDLEVFVEPERQPARRFPFLGTVATLVVAAVAAVWVVPAPATPVGSLVNKGRYLDAALAGLGVGEDAAASQDRPFTWWTRSGSSSFGTADDPLPAGFYDLTTTCVGTGSAELTVRFADALDQVAVPCSLPNQYAESNGFSIALTTAGVIEVAAALPEAGPAILAVAITNPLAAIASALLGPDWANPSSMFGTMVGTLGTAQSWSLGVDAGHYRLVLVCVGAGIVVASFGTNAGRDRQVVTCTPEGVRLELTAELAVEGTLEIDVQSAAGDAGRAGFAFQVTQPSV